MKYVVYGELKFPSRNIFLFGFSAIAYGAIVLFN